MSRWLMIMIMAAILVTVGCGKKESETDQGDKLTSEQRQMVRDYLTIKDTGMAGNAGQFMDLRDSLTGARVRTYFEMTNRVIDSLQVRQWAYYWPSVAGLSVVEDTSDGEWRRLLFHIATGVDDQGVEKSNYVIVLFRKNGEVWKVSNASLLMAPVLNPDGSRKTIDQLTYHRLFRIPPDFSDLEKIPGLDTTEIQAIPINPADLDGGD